MGNKPEKQRYLLELNQIERIRMIIHNIRKTNFQWVYIINISHGLQKASPPP